MPSRNVTARPIKWRICQDKRVNDLRDPWAMLAYTWMIPSADNLGRLDGDPELLASMIFPRQRDVITPEYMAKILRQLHACGLAFTYTVNGERYLQFPFESWAEHQRLVGNMKAESDFPPPPEDEYTAWVNETRSVNTGIYPLEPVIKEGEGKGREEEITTTATTARAREKNESVLPLSLENLLAEYQEATGVAHLSKRERGAVLTLASTYTAEWVSAAIEDAINGGARGKLCPNYLKAILERWMIEGFRTPRARASPGSESARRTTRDRDNGRQYGRIEQDDISDDEKAWFERNTLRSGPGMAAEDGT